MKSLMMSTVAMIATLTVINACTSSSPNQGSITQGTDAKVQAQSKLLVGSFKGVSAVCENGSEAKLDHESATATTLTFNADGTYKSETKVSNSKTDSPLETSGKYSTSGEILTLVKETQSYDGQVGMLTEESRVIYKLDEPTLTVTIGATEDSSCPPEEALIIKYQRQ